MRQQRSMPEVILHDLPLHDPGEPGVEPEMYLEGSSIKVRIGKYKIEELNEDRGYRTSWPPGWAI